MGAVWAPENVISKSLGFFFAGVWCRWCICLMYLHLFWRCEKQMWVILVALCDNLYGRGFLLVQPTRWAWFVSPGAVTWCILCFWEKKQLQWIELSTWFLFVVFKGTSHKVTKHWLKTEVLLFLSWTCVIYQLYVVFPGVQKRFWFHFYTVCFTFSLFHCLTVTHNKI